MQRDRPERHRLFTGLQTDVVTKSDGRYLIYYEWPTEDRSRAEPSQQHAWRAAPASEPWSPETRPGEDA